MTTAQNLDAAPGGDGIVQGEFLFTEGDFQRIAAMLHADAGIALPETKAVLVYSRLAKRLRALGLRSFRDYCALISGSEGVDERQKMLAALTTNVTRFFREPHHFDHLKTRVLPPLLEQARRGGRVRIWSAACSTGQEPYSIALTILSLMPNAADYDIRVLATDIDPNVVAEGRDGVYRDSLLSDVPADVRAKGFDRIRADGGDAWSANTAMRTLVAFRELNLIGHWPMKGPFDAIFCRNVVIYFAEDTQAKIWNRFAPLLAPEGVLYIGHSERVNGAEHLYETDGLTTYRLKAGARR
jgi:chemotaxis protein methyltransferase CheR